MTSTENPRRHRLLRVTGTGFIGHFVFGVFVQAKYFRRTPVITPTGNVFFMFDISIKISKIIEQ